MLLNSFALLVSFMHLKDLLDILLKGRFLGFPLGFKAIFKTIVFFFVFFYKINIYNSFYLNMFGFFLSFVTLEASDCSKLNNLVNQEQLTSFFFKKESKFLILKEILQLRDPDRVLVSF